jgi:predicted ATP-dependent endonuclease of OLD family
VKIELVKVSNWRSIKGLEIKFQDLMIFIGQNNHGKSNILSSLLFFFGEIKPQELDFNYGSQELFVEILFSDLDEADQTTFKKYVTADKKIRVRKTAYIGGNFEYHGYTETPADEFLQESSAASYTKRDVAASLPFYQYLPEAGRLSKQDIVDAQEKYIQDNKDKISFNYIMEESNFLGLKSVAKGIFGNIYFIPAIKDASEDFSSKEASSFGKIFSKIVTDMSNNNDDWKSTKNNLTNLFGSLNEYDSNGDQNENRPTELVEFEELLSAELESWNAKINVEITPPNIDDVFRANTQVWVNDGVRTDIRRKGHGLQRALIFAMIKVMSDKASTINPDETSTRTSSNSSFFVLEEPELFLHPQAQRAMFDSLANLSGHNIQITLCTHSSALINVDQYKSICIVRKDSEAIGTRICQCTEEIFTGSDRDDFQLSSWLNPDRNELFFAKRVLLVEGPTEKAIIPRLAKNLDVFRYDYTLVDCASKSSIPLYCKLLNLFQIPYTAIYDTDLHNHKDESALTVAKRQTSELLAAINPDFGKSVSFEIDIENELGFIAKGKNKPYSALLKIEEGDYVIPGQLAQKITNIYE